MRLKTHSEVADIPINVVTASTVRGDEEQARQAGCDGDMSIPCRPQTIGDAVWQLLPGR